VADAQRIDVLQFMSLRQASTVDAVTWRLDFIHDDVRRAHVGADVAAAPPDGESAFAEMVVKEVFCTPDGSDAALVKKVLAGMRKVTVVCKMGKGPTGLAALDQLAMAHRLDDGTSRILPDRLATALDAADADLLTRLRAVLLAATVEPASPGPGPPPPLAIDELVKSIEMLLQGPLMGAVFDKARLADTFRLRLRVLFDALYALYILRRRSSATGRRSRGC
jgi:hypothetical protein